MDYPLPPLKPKQVSWLTCIEVMNILINVALIVVPALILQRLQMSALRKVSIVSIFALRLT